MVEKLALSLQQDLITLLVHSDEHGKVVWKLVSVDLYEGDYRHVAERAISGCRCYGSGVDELAGINKKLQSAQICLCQ